MNVKSKGLFFLLSLIFCAAGVYSSAPLTGFIGCEGVEINQPWLIVDNSAGDTVFIVDNEGDIYFEGNNHTNGASELWTRENLDSFEVYDAYFNSEVSYYVNMTENMSVLPTGVSGMVVRNSTGDDVAIFADDGQVYTTGKGFFNGSQANCGWRDGGYCTDSDTLEDRDYFCNSVLAYSGFCDMRVLSTTSCTSLNYNYCSGINVWKKLYTCEGPDRTADCEPTGDLFVVTCAAKANDYTAWSCTDKNTRTRVRTEYTTTCTGFGVCGHTSIDYTETESAPSGKDCRSGTWIPEPYYTTYSYTQYQYWACQPCGGSTAGGGEITSVSQIPEGKCDWISGASGSSSCASGMYKSGPSTTYGTEHFGSCGISDANPGYLPTSKKYYCY